ncbi:MAG TPA: putative glycoside hydrolase [Armatimonadota bacterium]|nr:putative glycoside hydrolase [Armatimonadota bacterium]
MYLKSAGIIATAAAALIAAGCQGTSNSAGSNSTTGPTSPPAAARATAAVNSPKGNVQTALATGPVGKPGSHNFVAHGLYATGWSAGSARKMDSLIKIIHETGLNSIVIDIKDSDGCVTYYTPDVPLAVSIGACFKKPDENRASNIDATLKKLKAAHIHVIGRVACFNDPILAKKRPDWAIRSKNGGVWHGRSGHAWVDPTVKALWKYDVDLAEDAIKRGFDEIQWDYVRFPSDGNTRLCVYHQNISHDRAWSVIAAYLNYAYKRLAKYNVPISADIFGLTGTAKSDMGIGQKINPIADNVDLISPMVYPSHFAHGEYHMPNPNTQPYKTVLLSLRDAKKRIADTHCTIRPWLQAFSLFGVHYGPEQVLAELKAVRDNHLGQFLCWNAGNKYDILKAALQSTEGKKLLAQIEANNNPIDHKTKGANTNVIAEK